jgi:hypothetical protein
MGWRMNVMDFLMHRYHMTFNQARLFPLGTTVLFMRHVRDVMSDGGSAGNPLVAAMVRARQRVRRWYEATHTIVEAIDAGGGA